VHDVDDLVNLETSFNDITLDNSLPPPPPPPMTTLTFESELAAAAAAHRHHRQSLDGPAAGLSERLLMGRQSEFPVGKLVEVPSTQPTVPRARCSLVICLFVMSDSKVYV